MYIHSLHVYHTQHTLVNIPKHYKIHLMRVSPTSPTSATFNHVAWSVAWFSNLLCRLRQLFSITLLGPLLGLQIRCEKSYPTLGSSLDIKQNQNPLKRAENSSQLPVYTCPSPCRGDINRCNIVSIIGAILFL